MVARKLISLPEWNHSPGIGAPAPFDAAIAFDAPWQFTAGPHLSWLVRVHGNSTGQGTRADAYSADYVDIGAPNNGTIRGIGRGCVPSTNTRFMSFNFDTWSRPNPDRFEVGGGLSGGPPNVAATILFGLGEIDVAVPGLCANLRVGRMISELPGTTDGGGSFLATSLTAPYAPELVGVPIVAQGAVLDAGQSGIPVALTSAFERVLRPLPPPPVDLALVMAPNDAAATQGSLTDRAGLIVELR